MTRPSGSSPVHSLIHRRGRPVTGVAAGVVAAASALALLASPAGAAGAPPTLTPHVSSEDTCVRPPVSGDTTVDVRYAGVAYPVLVHVPEDVPRGRALPLVLNLHGSSSNGHLQMDISDLRAVAAEEEFLVAAPNGAIALPSPTPEPDPNGSWAWNVPGVPTTAGEFPPAGARNDVGFLRRVINVVSEEVCAKPRRTYATGFSGGARMTSTLACRIPGRLAAVAPVAGMRAGRPDPDDVTVPEVEDCRPSRAVPVVAFHGQEDFVNPYPGNPDLRWGYSVPVAAQTWARLNACRRGPESKQVTEHVSRLRYRYCDGRGTVKLYRVSDGGHQWPGTPVPIPGLGNATQEIDASRLMWEFFQRHRLPLGSSPR